MLSITITDHKGEQHVSQAPAIGEVIRFSAQPYQFGHMRVTDVEIVGSPSSPMGERFKITGIAEPGIVTVSRLFQHTGSQDCAGEKFTIFCLFPASDGGWDYAYPV